MTVMSALGFILRFRDMAIAHHDTEESAYIDAEASFIPLVALVPASALYRFWTFATASFFERSIIQAGRLELHLLFTYAFNLAILLGSGKYLERAWGSREFFKFISITSIGSMIGIYVTCLFEYGISGNDELLYDTQAHGLTAVVAGFLIGFKQLVPDHLVTLWAIFSVRVKTLPLLFVLFMVFEGLISHTQIQFLMAIYGLFISWIYSRFFRVQDGIRGDRSETFSFASFFPEFLQPPVKVLSNSCFGILVKLNICSPTGYGGSFQYDLENPQMAGMGHTFTQPGSLRAEAERRRALALKALDMRLHAAAGNNTPFSGSLRSGGTASSAPPVSLLSLSAEPVPNGADEDEDEVLFESTVLDMNALSSTPSPATQPAASGPSSRASTSESKTDKERQ
ncbi:hypothetical protein EDD11_005779 [Mortierella claussenii]|nr:hypothetical protein EDD11_005779 [Mortierella claussenii]